MDLTLNLLRLQSNPKLFGRIFFTRLALHILGRKRNSNESLGLANGSAFFKLHDIPNLELVLWVVSLVLLLLPHPPLVLRVWGQASDLNGDGLVACGADDSALKVLQGSNGREERLALKGWEGERGSGFGERRERGGGAMEELGGELGRKVEK